MQKKNIEVVNFFPEKDGITIPFPDIVIQATDAVSEKKCDEAILLCWTGTGVCIAANKIFGIRAALCIDAQTAKGARQWNDANVLCLSTRLTSAPLAKEILTSWFTSHYVANLEDDACIAKLNCLDAKRNHS